MVGLFKNFRHTVASRRSDFIYKNNWERLHLEPLLLIGIALLSCTGLLILYSASQQSMAVMSQQLLRLGTAACALFIAAQISPQTYRNWAPMLFILGLVLLTAVLVMGKIGKGAQRWLDLGFIRFQPSELLKIAIPLLVARYLSQVESRPSFRHLLVASLITIIPGFLIAKQPDLGTALMIMGSGACIIVLSGIRASILMVSIVCLMSLVPIGWRFLHDYQKQRVLTFLNPEHDPLGSGYHIIQSKIALGSGGLFGKGWFKGSQAHLQFLPEHTTDFIFAVIGEEWGLIGCFTIISIYLLISLRILMMAYHIQPPFNRLVAGGLGLIFLTSAYVNIGMVCGLLPVVGVPLPLISYGGTSLLTQMISFGIIMSMQSQKKLLGN